MAAMVPKAREIDPRDCRRSADRFLPERMDADYETVYHEVLEAGVEARQAVR
jgi:hypothetical protein